MIKSTSFNCYFIKYLFLLLLLQQWTSYSFPSQRIRSFTEQSANLRLQSTISDTDRSTSSAKKTVQVVIAGGGPAGLLTALTLLNRNEYFPDASVNYKVRILESNEDPRVTPLGPRSYPLGLGLRGQYVLQGFEQGDRPRWRGLWRRVQDIGIETDRLFVHLNRWKLPIRQPADPSIALSQPLIAVNTTKSLLIQRNKLCTVLLDFLLQQTNTSDAPSVPPLSISFQTKISAIDFSQRRLELSSGESLTYDLLLGCDGVNSVVRRSLQAYLTSSSSSLDITSTVNAFKSEEVELPWQFKVMSQSIPSNLEGDAIHAFPDLSRFTSSSSSSTSSTSSTSSSSSSDTNSKEDGDSSSQGGFSLFAIPTINGQLAAVINWKRAATPPFLALSHLSGDDVTPALQKEVEDIFEKQCPAFGKPSLEAIRQLVGQRASNIRKVRCNRYHYTKGRVALLGDAVHATDATWGQGLSATFLDIAAFDDCLTEFDDDLSLALPRYSEKQVKEGLALWQLIALPPRGLIGLFYSAAQFMIGLGRRVPVLGKTLPLPIQYLISKTLMPYSDIVQQNEYWTNIATAGQEPFTYTPEPATQSQD